MRAAKSTKGRKVLSRTMLDQSDRARLRELQRTKLLANGVLVAKFGRNDSGGLRASCCTRTRSC